jgi:hypothetical protein
MSGNPNKEIIDKPKYVRETVGIFADNSNMVIQNLLNSWAARGYRYCSENVYLPGELTITFERIDEGEK